MTIEIDVETYIDMLEQRKNFVVSKYGWREPSQSLWEYFLEIIRECGVDPRNADPSYIVDDFIVNGDWGDFDEYENDESDEDFIARIEDNAIFIDKDERVVWF